MNAAQQTQYVWSFNRFLPQFGKALSVEEYMSKDCKYTVVQYYSFLERQYSEPLKRLIEDVHSDLVVPIELINIITVYNSGGIIYDYTKSFEQYTNGNVVYIAPIIMGYIETALFLSLFLIMLLMHLQFDYGVFGASSPSAYQHLSQLLLVAAVAYAVMLFLHTLCVIISYRQCRKYEVIIRNFKRSLYSNPKFSHHVRMIDMKSLEPHDNDDGDDNDAHHNNEVDGGAAANDGSAQYQRLNVGVGAAATTTTAPPKSKSRTEALSIDIHGLRDDNDEDDNDHGVPAYHNNSPSTSASASYTDGVMERWQFATTFKETQQDEYLSILNPSNNSFAFVAYQRWLNVKKLELENDAFTRSKSALVLNLAKYWLTSYFTLIIILIFVLPNSVYLYFAFVLTLFVIYYSYLRTIKKLDHSAALKKVLYLLCSFVIGTIITLVIIFATDPWSVQSISSSGGGDGGDAGNTVAGNGDGHETASSINHAQQDMADDSDVTFWIFDILFPTLEGLFALLYTYICVSLVYKIVRRGQQGYQLWLCCVNAFGFWVLTFWIPSWKITELAIVCALCLLIATYLYLQQISHRIMTGLDKAQYINKHCAPNPKQWIKDELKQLFVPYFVCTSSTN